LSVAVLPALSVAVLPALSVVEEPALHSLLVRYSLLATAEVEQGMLSNESKDRAGRSFLYAKRYSLFPIFIVPRETFFMKQLLRLQNFQQKFRSNSLNW
jgi:hypothetical protein